ncbi:MAG: hypothetical protein GC134_06960 [Proteobacteria bacterium]|nr:hypothetical protein [Pseudomonadota bacterium]
MVAISSFFKALGSLSRADMMRLMLLSAALTFGGMLALSGITTWALTATTFFQTGWLDTVVDVLGGLAAFIIPMLLFPAFMPLVAGFFEDRIISIVETNDYPGTPAPQERPFLPELMQDLKFVAISLTLNVLLLPLYLIPLVGQAVFVLLNGYLMGREFFTIAAGRHMGKAEANTYRKANRITALVGGMAIAGISLIPVVNLLVPFVGIVLMVHVYHGLKRRTA